MNWAKCGGVSEGFIGLLLTQFWWAYWISHALVRAMNVSNQPPPTFGEKFSVWWSRRRPRTKAALIVGGLFVIFLIVVSLSGRGEYLNSSVAEPLSDPSPAIASQHLTTEMMSTPEFRAGWDEVFRLHWNDQASEPCNVVKQAIANQGGVYAAWEALHRQAGDDPQTAYEYFAGVVMACHSIFGQ